MQSKPSFADSMACWSCARWTALKTGAAALLALGAAAWTGEVDWLKLAAILAAFGFGVAVLSLLVPARQGGTCNVRQRNDAL